MGMWQIEMEPIKDWLDGLDKQTAYQVYAALDLLRECGPNLKRPLVGKIEGSIIGSMKELRPGSTGRSEVRILFVFDPERKAVLLVGGDKQNKWNKWYKTAIREAERRYIRWLEGHEMSYTLEDFKADHDLDQKTIDERKEQLLEEMRLYELKEARKQQDVTQKQLAERMGVSQKRVSSLESGDVDKTEIRTLRRYLDAIGGRLQVNAIMPDGRTLQLV